MKRIWKKGEEREEKMERGRKKCERIIRRLIR